MYKIVAEIKKEMVVFFEDYVIEKFNGSEQDIDNELCYIIYSEEKEIPDDFEKYVEKYTVEDIGDEWKEKWKYSVKPFEYKNFYVHTPWNDDKKNKTNIIINPSMAFGTGAHETTSLCLEYIIDLEKKPTNFLDIGTGSGILSIVAHLTGIKNVEGFDIDNDAIISAKENLELNNVQNDLVIKTADINDYTKKYNFILSNMITERLKMVVDKAWELLENGGTLVLSGIMGSEVEDFKIYLKNRFRNMKITAEKSKKEWRLLELVKN